MAQSVAGGGDGVFYREYWGERQPEVSNTDGRFLRVNDAELSLHPTFGRRREARSNGLLLVEAPEDLFQVEAAELYLELWGGHPGTAAKRFMLNGRGPYMLPEVGTEAGHCTYSYPTVPLSVSHLVRGVNAFQFACDRGETFWGHYIVDNACLRVYLKPTHPDLEAAGMKAFSARVKAPSVLGGRVEVRLEFPDEFADAVESVDFYARYRGFDDDGSGQEGGWHGFTLHRQPINHVGTAASAPFVVAWDTSMIPTQDGPMAVRAAVHLRGGLHYLSPATDGLVFAPDRPRVELFRCVEMPRPFWSRASRERVGIIRLPQDLSEVERAQLLVKVWDGGAGEVQDPFTINGHAYDVLSGRAIHDVVFTRAEVSLDHLHPGDNVLRVLSDTEHHGIEVLLPGPCLVLRYRQ